ncbi:RHS repeat domain-containing protein, partial [Pseudomonas sp. 5P_5.1_Bac1]|uniref:RHS repeat domain-containing protein n=1 Tax=Pseudomonas sp. 5P_5.1_Bac1 TaxID=2971616 RepID=UPI0021C88489
PVLRTQHRYLSQPGLSGSAWPWLALEQETLVHVNGGNAELQKTRHTYLNAPSDKLLHGRKSQTAVTLNGKTTTTDYAYLKATGQYVAQPVLRTMETLKTNFDAVSKVIILEHSLLNGRALLERDDNDVEIAYAYDALGRVIEEKVAPGSNVEARRQYQYLLVNQVTGQPTQTTIDVKGVQTRSLLDGLQRVVSELRQDVDGNPVSKPLRETYSASYDAFGQLSESTEFDWLGAETVALTSRYTYDDWSEQDSVTGPDGVTEYSRNDPVALRVETWREGMGKTVTRNNLFEKPVTVERFDLAGGKVSLYEYFYDGLGRTSHEYDELRQFRFYRYDAFDRLTLQGLPDSAQVERRYAEHSTEDLPTWIGVDGVVLGEQSFDGLERMYRSVTGGRERTFAFDGGQQQPSSVTTAKGQVIDYEYNPNLGEAPIQRRIQNVTADYEYDKDNARLLSSRENDQSLNCTYYSTGELKTEQRVNAGQTRNMAYEYSLRGRLLAYTDVLGQQQRYHYDAGGRLESTSLGQTETHFSYNASGLTSRIVTEDKAEGHSVRIDLEYDDFGREILRTFTFDDGVIQTLEQRYNVRDALEQRTLRQGSVLRDESYTYDSRGRLEDYRCTGSDLPLDSWGKPIQRQVFEFDVLDNLIQVRTVFPGGENLATYLFEGQDPTQLSAVRNSHADYPALISLDYDADGNLISDEQGRNLSYDALGRLLSVSEDGSEMLEYRYDAQDILSGSIGGEGDEQRFYCDGQLVNQLQGGEQRTFIRGGDHVLAERVTGQDELLLATDAKKTVLAERDSQTRNSAYSAHGFRSSSTQLTAGLGFNGECLERSGVYLLGSYRAYNPVLGVFCSPDSWSPFGEGGLNGYTYCLGDPVNHVDPTGHMPWWVGIVGGVVATLLTAGLAAPIATTLGVSATAAAAVSSVAAKVALGATALSIGSGVGSSFVEEGALKQGLEWTSHASGVIAGVSTGLALGMKAAASSLASRASAVSGGSNSWGTSSSFFKPRPGGQPSIGGSSSSSAALRKAQDDIYERAIEPVPHAAFKRGNYSNPAGMQTQPSDRLPLFEVRGSQLKQVLRIRASKEIVRGNKPY